MLEGTVLTISDDQLEIRTLKGLLEREGIEVFIAYGLDIRISIVRAIKPDVVVVGSVLPLDRGREFVRFIHPDPFPFHLRVLQLRSPQLRKVVDVRRIDDPSAVGFEPLPVSALRQTIRRILTYHLTDAALYSQLPLSTLNTNPTPGYPLVSVAVQLVSSKEPRPTLALSYTVRDGAFRN